MREAVTSAGLCRVESATPRSNPGVRSCIAVCTELRALKEQQTVSAEAAVWRNLRKIVALMLQYKT
jgi:hypothetical protein